VPKDPHRYFAMKRPVHLVSYNWLVRLYEGRIYNIVALE
jgi:hypothetical protein